VLHPDSSVTSRAAKPGPARLQVVNTGNPQFIPRKASNLRSIRSAAIRAGGHLAVFSCYCTKLSATEVSFSAETLGRQSSDA
jgi:hypothetical protein